MIQRKDKTNMAKANKTDDRVLLYENTGKKKKPSKTAKPISEILKLANPVTEMANKIRALLSYDARVLTEFDYDKHTLWVYVSDPDVCEAYKFFLKRRHEFGGLALDVKLVSTYQGGVEEVDEPTYKITEEEKVRLFRLLFKGGLDPRYYNAIDQYGTVWNFFEFPCFGVAYQADDLQNIQGMGATLVCDLVKEVFEVGFYHISSICY